MDGTDSVGDDGTDLWSDSPEVSSNLDLSNTAPAPSSSIISRSIARAAVDTNKIYFRSSDIEFWSITEESDLNSIFSSKYKRWNEVNSLLGYAEGALVIPLDPVDISSFDSSVNTLQIEVSWDIANSIHLRNGEYFMDNRVGNTSFNFEVALTIQDK